MKVTAEIQQERMRVASEQILLALETNGLTLRQKLLCLAICTHAVMDPEVDDA